ncbi:sulfite exporter TauE/SafE family protein [Endozoicomonas ascidiicola]|uniref:sulfite exporter TauE/SafE family protein n=1 Tax=Endozoicomonas ascidiicola TaxID=1698521 RepID=UPI000A5AA973|nr:sulfite exporter TauE/SafE family protein [Endozoicomonas ascidiicola]
MEWYLVSPVFLAAVIRGYTGFGFAAIAILVLGQSYSVAESVPAVLMLDAVAGLPLLLGSWRHCCPKTLNSLLIASSVGIPIGLFLLFTLDEPALRLLVAVVILAMGLLSYLPSQRAILLTRSRWLCGVMSGWTTSAVSAGGIPVIMYMMSSSLSLEKQRATLIVYFISTSILCATLILSGATDLDAVFSLFFMLLPFCIVGALAGKVLFHLYTTAIVQQVAFLTMMLLAFFSLINALQTMITTA